VSGCGRHRPAGWHSIGNHSHVNLGAAPPGTLRPPLGVRSNHATTTTTDTTMADAHHLVDDHAPVVTARGLVLRHGDVVAVDHADLDLPAGGVTAIIGPNGSGKTTLLRALSGLHRPSTGELLVCGAPPGRHAVAHVLQVQSTNDRLPVTVSDVVAMGRWGRRGPFRRLTAADHAAVDEAMERMEVTDLADRHLDELSGGQRQRVHVAQGLVQEAELLLLDEPGTGLDLPSLDRIATVLGEETAAGRTVVLTTHEIHTAAAADHVVLIATRVVAEGPPEEVLDPAHLTEAYGGHLHELPGGALVVDDPTPHAHGHASAHTGERGQSHGHDHPAG